MEREIKIKTKDRTIIYGMLRGSLRRPVIVFVHGLLGSMHRHTYFNGARYFEKHGFSSFRFNLYDWRKGARKLHECTLKTHADDLDYVIEYLRKRGAKKVFVVGHSYGGPTIMMSKKKVYDAAVFWDSSYGKLITFQKRTRYVKSLHGYVVRWSYDVVIGSKMIKEANTFTGKKSEALMRNMRVPVKIIVAGNGMLVEGGRAYFKAAHPPKAFVVIKGADHSFNREGNEEALFRETLDWLRKWR